MEYEPLIFGVSFRAHPKLTDAALDRRVIYKELPEGAELLELINSTVKEAKAKGTFPLNQRVTSRAVTLRPFIHLETLFSTVDDSFVGEHPDLFTSNIVHVSIPRDGFNIFAVPCAEYDHQAERVMRPIRFGYRVDTAAIMELWIGAGCPLEWKVTELI